MTDHPINTTYVDGANVSKASVRSYESTYNRIRVPSFAWVRARDLTDCFGFDYRSTYFDLDTSDTTTADDGAYCIVDVVGNRFKRIPFSVITTTTTTPLTISSSAQSVYFNVAGAAAATLPDAATWRGVNGDAELLLKDISGAAAANNITISRAGSNTIDGLTSFVISSNYGFFRLRVTPANNWTFVG